MKPDEYEARLRDAVLREVDELIIDGIDHGNLPWKYERPNANGVCPSLDAYAEWLRLRAVADDHREYCVCLGSCAFTRRMAEVLAAAEVTA